MIRKRERQTITETTDNKSSVDNKKPEKIRQFKDDKHLTFKTYREEAIYVINLLKSQGIDIYEEGRFGGMYLRNRDGNQNIRTIFNSKKVDKKDSINTTVDTNNVQQPNNIRDFFNKHNNK